MRSLRVDLMCALPLPDEGGLDAEAAVLELAEAVRLRFVDLRTAAAASRADARELGPYEPVVCRMHVCTHEPTGAVIGCGNVVEIE